MKKQIEALVEKWDLQIHTPYSYLNTQFGDDFDLYVKIFQKSIRK